MQLRSTLKAFMPRGSLCWLDAVTPNIQEAAFAICGRVSLWKMWRGHCGFCHRRKQMLEIFFGEENEHTVLIDSPGQQGSPVSVLQNSLLIPAATMIPKTSYVSPLFNAHQSLSPLRANPDADSAWFCRITPTSDPFLSAALNHLLLQSSRSVSLGSALPAWDMPSILTVSLILSRVWSYAHPFQWLPFFVVNV